MLIYAQKLTEQPSAIDDADVDALKNAGWEENGIWEATALISFFNFSGRMEAASGLGEDEIPEGAELAEAAGESGAK